MVMAQIWKRGNIVKAVIYVTQFTLLPKLFVLTNIYMLQNNILF